MSRPDGRHRIAPNLTAWTFGYTSGTRGLCLICQQPITYVVGPRRMYWKHDSPSSEKAR